MEHIIYWCSLCNARPSDGQLTVEDPITKEPLTIQACEICVNELDWEDGIVKKGNDHA